MSEIIEIIISSILLLLAFLLFYFKLTRSWLPQRRPQKKLKEPEEKPAPAVPAAKRGIPGYLKTVITLVIILAIIALVWTVVLPAIQQGKISIPSLPQGELYGHYSSNSVQKPDGSWVATINPKIAWSEASRIPVKGNIKTIFEATGGVKTTTRKDDLAYHDPFGPEGDPDNPSCRDCLVPNSPWMGLVAKYVSSDEESVSYFNFTSDQIVETFPKDGNVYFAANEVVLPDIPWAFQDNVGGFVVTVSTAKK